METVKKRISHFYDRFTPKQKVIAKFILEDPEQVALKTAMELGKLTNTSETTIIRLSYALGYSGFSELQDQLRRELLWERAQGNTLFSNLSKMSQHLEHEDVLSAALQQDIADITRVGSKLDQQVYRTVVEQIIKADKIIIQGFRSSYAPAYWLQYTLNLLRGNVHLYRGIMDDAHYLLRELGSNDLIISISFPRYSKEVIELLQAAKTRHTVSVAITDNELAPIAKLSDYSLLVHLPEPTALKGMTAIFSVLHALVLGVSHVDKENVDRKLLHYDGVRKDFNPFYQGVEVSNIEGEKP